MLLVGLGFWVAAAAGSDIFDLGADEPTIVSPATETTLALPDDIEILTPAAPPTTQPILTIATFSDNNVDFDVLSCGPDTIVGVVSTALFDIGEVEMLFTATGENTPETFVPAPSLDARDLDLRAGHTVAIDLPDALVGSSCQVRSAVLTPVRN